MRSDSYIQRHSFIINYANKENNSLEMCANMVQKCFELLIFSTILIHVLKYLLDTRVLAKYVYESMMISKKVDIFIL